MIEEYESRLANVVFPPKREDSFYTDEQLDQYFAEYRSCVETLEAIDTGLLELIERLESERNAKELDEEFEDIAYLKRLRDKVLRKLGTGRAHMASMVIARVLQGR